MSFTVLAESRTTLNPVMNYIITHWRGQQSLAWSFWINLVALRVAVFALQSWLQPVEGADYSQWRMQVLVLAFLVHGLLLGWQLVGVVRAADSDFATRGNMALVWGAQLGAVLMFLLSAVYMLGAAQMTMASVTEENPLIRMDREHASLYNLTVSDSGTQLAIDGNIELGITRAARKLLLQYPAIKRVVLDSPGGNVYEGRGLAMLFREHALDTHNEGVCASACTTAYAGGRKRTASKSARFGFHQYRVDADYAIIVTDPAKEQARDSLIFRQAGVSDEFIDILFHRVPTSMWWPSLDELSRAGLVHERLP